jgi:hypothetical protein
MSHKFDYTAAVYDGQTLLGFLHEIKPSRRAVYDADQLVVGEFSSRSPALDAVYRKESKG